MVPCERPYRRAGPASNARSGRKGPGCHDRRTIAPSPLPSHPQPHDGPYCPALRPTPHQRAGGLARGAAAAGLSRWDRCRPFNRQARGPGGFAEPCGGWGGGLVRCDLHRRQRRLPPVRVGRDRSDDDGHDRRRLRLRPWRAFQSYDDAGGWFARDSFRCRRCRRPRRRPVGRVSDREGRSKLDPEPVGDSDSSTDSDPNPRADADADPNRRAHAGSSANRDPQLDAHSRY